jgi:uncharacterized protein (TIGR03086 family)
MHTTFDVVAFDACAVRASVELLAQACPADLARPTPCAEWTLLGLVTHMTAQHYGFAAAAAGDDDPARWQPRRLGPDPVADYRASAETVLAAFAADGVFERPFPLPGFSVGPSVPARQAISFHFIDYVAHSWDVARTLGLELSFPPDLLAAAGPVAEGVPDGDSRRAPGAVFAPAWLVPGGSALDRVVAALGRYPNWRPPRFSDASARFQGLGRCS